MPDDSPSSRAPSDRKRSLEAFRELLKALQRDLRESLRRTRGPASRSRKTLSSLIVFGGVSALAVLVFVAGGLLWVLYDLPINENVLAQRDREIILESSAGDPIGRVGPLKISAAARSDFPASLVSAVISVEDRSFFTHWGVDPSGMARAATRNYLVGAVVEGGSTITQQLVKMRLLSRERTYGRKLREALAAIWFDMRLSKDQILTSYLNSVYLGSGVQGMAAGAKVYFDKPLSNLNLPESALLAGLIKAPSRFNPVTNLEGARRRTAVVLDAMVETGALSKQEAEDAKANPATLRYSPDPSGSGSWYADWVSAEAREATGSFSGSLRVRTTLDAKIQEMAQKAVNDGLAERGDANASEAALVAMKPDGSVIAMVGGRDYAKSQFNRAVQAQRQAGSAFKLFVYLAALRNGMKPEDTVEDAPYELDGWEPENYGNTYRGTISLSEAFARSSNTAAVRLSQRAGLDEVIRAARDLGLNTPIQKVPSLALGAADVSLLNLTSAYAAVLADRYPIRPWGVSAFTPATNARQISLGPPLPEQHSLGAEHAPLITLLRGVIEHGTARAAALPGFAAGKTGTSQNYRDAWFIGFNDSLVVGVWVGNDDRAPMNGITGGSLPAAIWRKFMMDAAPLVVAPSEKTPEPLPVAPAAEASTSYPPTSTSQCDYRRCAAQYRSFDPADCTYQPFGREARIRCGKEGEPAAPQSADLGQVQKTSSGTPCNVGECSATYSSFDAATCTYQPYDGGQRRACTK